MNLPGNFTPSDFIIAFLMGIPFGLSITTRAKYLYVPMVGGAIFFIAFSAVRYAQGTFTGGTFLVGIAFELFLLGAYLTAIKLNPVSKTKEELIGYLEKHATDENITHLKSGNGKKWDGSERRQ